MPDLSIPVADLIEAGGLIIALQLLLLLVATVIALRYGHLTVAAALARLFEREAQEGTAQDVSAMELARRRETLDGLINRALRVIILTIAFLMALQVLRLDIGPAIAGLGIVGLTLSLGAQHLVRDYVAGAFVLIENQYSKGDIVSIAGVTGLVEDISLRRTTLRDDDGTVHYLPHGLNHVASNLTRTWARVNVDVPVPYEESLARLTAAIDGAGRGLAEDPQWRGHVLEPPHVTRVERLAEQGLVLRVGGTVTAPHRFTAGGELRRRIVETCEREGLTLGWRPLRQQPDAPPTINDTGRKT